MRIKTGLNLALITLLLFLISCSRPASTRPLATENITTSPPKECWLLQPQTFHLRQSAKLEYRDKQEIFEGFIKLDLKQSRAHLVIFTALGVTLLNLEISQNSYSFSNKDPHNKREQRFASVVASTVQKIFFSLKTHNGPNSQLVAKFSNTSTELPKLVKISEKKSDPDWFATYDDYHKYPCGWLPQRITLQSHKPKFKLTLWLHNAKAEKVIHNDP